MDRSNSMHTRWEVCCISRPPNIGGAPECGAGSPFVNSCGGSTEAVQNQSRRHDWSHECTISQWWITFPPSCDGIAMSVFSPVSVCLPESSFLSAASGRHLLQCGVSRAGLLITTCWSHKWKTCEFFNGTPNSGSDVKPGMLRSRQVEQCHCSISCAQHLASHCVFACMQQSSLEPLQVVISAQPCLRKCLKVNVQMRLDPTSAERLRITPITEGLSSC